MLNSMPSVSIDWAKSQAIAAFIALSRAAQRQARKRFAGPGRRCRPMRSLRPLSRSCGFFRRICIVLEDSTGACRVLQTGNW
jgi:hypothetical protein